MDTAVALVHSSRARWATGDCGEMAILHLTRGTWTFLDGIAAVVWPYFATSASIADMCARMADQYQVTVEQVHEKYDAVLQELIAARLLVEARRAS